MSSKIRKNIVLLAGGVGKRLWPFSKESCPKQFISIPNLNLSTFQLAIKNIIEIAESSDIIITASRKHEILVKKQINDLGLSAEDFSFIFKDNNINTAKAIYDSCCFILDKKGNNNLTYFFPTDHIILDSYNIFVNIIEKIDVNRINLFGEVATELCNSFGYMVVDKKISEKYYEIIKFIEKPSINQHQNFADGSTYRNIGIYLSRPSILLNEFNYLCVDMNFCNSPIDKLISERSKIMNLVEVNFNWKDIGSIESLYKYCKDIIFDNTNVKEEDIYTFNQQNNDFKIHYHDNGKLQIIEK